MKIVSLFSLISILINPVFPQGTFPGPLLPIGDTVFYSDYIKRTWDDCNTQAGVYNMDFASIRSEEENLSIGFQAWIGGKQDCSTCPYYWVDGSPFDFTAWSSNEPNNDVGFEPYINVKHSGLWMDNSGSFPDGSPREYYCVFRHIQPWDIGDAEIEFGGSNSSSTNFFSGVSTVSHKIGININRTVEFQLLDYSCSSQSPSNESNVVSISDFDGDARPVTYQLTIDDSKFDADPQNYVSFSGPSHSPSASGEVEFCVRLLAYLESIKVGFHESRFRFTFDMSSDFDLVDVGINDTDSDDLGLNLNSPYTVEACQCEDFVCSEYPVNQTSNLYVCIYPDHPTDPSDVEITNFNLKLYTIEGEYFEYNPVWITSDGWESDALTKVERSDQIVMITTVVVAEFFVLGNEEVRVSGNVFLGFTAQKGERTPVIGDYFTAINIIVPKPSLGCFAQLLHTIRKYF